MKSIAPFTFGASVTSRILPPDTSFNSFTKSASGSVIHSSTCAPFLTGSRNGPSILIPATVAPSPDFSASLIPLKIFLSCSFGSVMEVGQYDVIPLCLSYLKIFFRPSGSPSEKSSPYAPWLWISTRPGITIRPSASITSSSAVASNASVSL